MLPLTWDQVRRFLGPTLAQASLPEGAPPVCVDGLSTDSRSIGKGEWFVPIVGETFDGHAYVGEVMQRGAAGFLYQAERVTGPVPAGGIAVTDTLAAFQALAHGWRMSLKDVGLLALTGSTGKTTCKEMLGLILKAAGPALATEASFNNEIGVPKTLLALRPEHRYGALEFGARMPGNIRFLCEMSLPNVVGLINVGITHVGIFGSVQALLDTKLEIFRDSPDHTVQVAFGDDPRILAGAKATKKQTLVFGRLPEADVRIIGERWRDDGGMTLDLSVVGKTQKVELSSAHQAYPVNAAAAAAMATAAGIPLDAVVSGLQAFRGIKGRYQIHQLRNLTLIDDTYNASPDSMISGMSSLARSFAGKTKVLVLGDMLELGDESATEHARVGAYAGANVKPEWLYVVGTDAQHIAAGATGAGFPASRVQAFATIDQLLAADIPFADRGEVLFAKASNGMRLGRLVERLKGGAR